MGHVDILKKLEKRRRRAVELNRSMVSSIQYQADVRRNIDQATMRAEHTRIRGQLSKVGAWHPQFMRDQYEQLTKALGH